MATWRFRRNIYTYVEGSQDLREQNFLTKVSLSECRLQMMADVPMRGVWKDRERIGISDKPSIKYVLKRQTHKYRKRASGSRGGRGWGRHGVGAGVDRFKISYTEWTARRSYGVIHRRKLHSPSRDKPSWKRLFKKKTMYTRITESLCYTVVINTSL